MTTQPEALRLADLLEDQYDPTFCFAEAAAELRRLHAENEALRVDAERYRWLRENCLTEAYDGQLGIEYAGDWDNFSDINAAIDAARSEK